MLNFEVIPVTQFAQNCSLIWCDETHQAALIDPGGEADKLLTAIAKRGLTLTHILLTHGHLDHVGAAAELREKTGVAITGPHKEDAFWLDMLPQQSQMFGFAHTPAFTPDHWLEQGDKVKVGQCELEVYFCPGHTPGHVVLLSQTERLAWVGDVLFAGSIGRTDFPVAITGRSSSRSPRPCCPLAMTSSSSPATVPARRSAASRQAIPT